MNSVNSLMKARYPKRILIVDDDKLRLFVNSVILRSRRYHVLARSTPESALRVLKADRVDLAVLDCQMSGIDPLKFAALCKTEYPQMKVVFLCADISRRQELAFVDLFISKSDGVRALVKGIEALIPASNRDAMERQRSHPSRRNSVKQKV